MTSATCRGGATRDPVARSSSRSSAASRPRRPRAVAAYERCCERFPTPAACAAAPLRDVLEAWRGLGYYRRARALHEAAIADRRAARRRGPRRPRRAARAPRGRAVHRARRPRVRLRARRRRRRHERRPRARPRRRRTARSAPSEAQRLADALVAARPRAGRTTRRCSTSGRRSCGPTPSCDALRAAAELPRGAARDGRAPDPARSHGVRLATPGALRGLGPRGSRSAARRGARRPRARSTSSPTVTGWPDDPARARRVADAPGRRGARSRSTGGALARPRELTAARGHRRSEAERARPPVGCARAVARRRATHDAP